MMKNGQKKDAGSSKRNFNSRNSLKNLINRNNHKLSVNVVGWTNNETDAWMDGWMDG